MADYEDVPDDVIDRFRVVLCAIKDRPFHGQLTTSSNGGNPAILMICYSDQPGWIELPLADLGLPEKFEGYPVLGYRVPRPSNQT